jgi:putative spermidine/putrescine transport system ATP-binding protein
MDAGRIVQLADPLTLYDAPASRFAAAFVGRSSQLPATVTAVDGSIARMRIDGLAAEVGGRLHRPVSVGQAVLIALRPEKVQLGAPGTGAVDGRLQSRVFQGSSWLFSIQTELGSVLVSEPHRGIPHFREGDAVSIAWMPEDAAVVPEAPRG